MKYLKSNSRNTWYSVINGITFKSTPGHGWLVLASYRLEQMKKRHPELVLTPPLHGYMTNYEEDCEINLPILAFWKEMQGQFDISTAIKSTAYWYPVIFCRWVLACVESREINEILDAVGGDFPIKFRESDMIFQTEWVFADYVKAVEEYLPEIKGNV